MLIYFRGRLGRLVNHRLQTLYRYCQMFLPRSRILWVEGSGHDIIGCQPGSRATRRRTVDRLHNRLPIPRRGIITLRRPARRQGRVASRRQPVEAVGPPGVGSRGSGGRGRNCKSRSPEIDFRLISQWGRSGRFPSGYNTRSGNGHLPLLNPTAVGQRGTKLLNYQRPQRRIGLVQIGQKLLFRCRVQRAQILNLRNHLR